MYIELTNQEIVNRLMRDEYANWSRPAAEALAVWYENYYEGIGENPPCFDAVAIRCEWTEYDTPAEALQDYGLSSFTLEGQEWLEGYHTELIRLPNGGILVHEY